MAAAIRPWQCLPGEFAHAVRPAQEQRHCQDLVSPHRAGSPVGSAQRCRPLTAPQLRRDAGARRRTRRAPTHAQRRSRGWPPRTHPFSVLIVRAEPRRRRRRCRRRRADAHPDAGRPPRHRRRRAPAGWSPTSPPPAANSFALDVASNNPLRMLRNAVALDAARARAQCDVDPRARPRRRLERADRRAPARHSVRDQLVQGLPRAEPVQALLQRRDGARRPRHRGRASRSRN